MIWILCLLIFLLGIYLLTPDKALIWILNYCIRKDSEEQGGRGELDEAWIKKAVEEINTKRAKRAKEGGKSNG